MFRDVLYMMILIGGGKILESEALHSHEAFLVSGIVAVLAVLLLEPSRQQKVEKGFIYFTFIISFYGFWFKLPMILAGSLNYYVIKFIALALMATVFVGVFILHRKLMRPADTRDFYQV